MANIRGDSQQFLVSAEVHTGDPGSNDGTPPHAASTDTSPDAPIDAQSKQRIDNLLENIIQGNNRTPGDHDQRELAEVKEKITSLEAAIQQLTTLLLHTEKSAVTHRANPGSEEATPSDIMSETSSEAIKELSPVEHASTPTVAILPSPVDEEEDLNCVYCTAHQQPHRHTSSACTRFPK